MQYLQIKPQNAADVPIPASGQLNCFIDTSDNKHKGKTSTGAIVLLGSGEGGSSAPAIPTPIVATSKNELLVKFSNNGSFDFSQEGVDLFLFRQNANRRFKSNGSHPKFYYPYKWRHPSDYVNAQGKWAGWAYFSGAQKISGLRKRSGVDETAVDHNIPDTELINRKTEWSLTGINPVNDFIISVNPYMFWKKLNYAEGTIVYDSLEVFSQAYINVNEKDSETLLRNRIPNVTELVPSTSISVRSRKAKSYITQRFCLAVAIDNPLATKQNGLCPKIFGDFSDPFYSSIILDIGGDTQGNRRIIDVFLTRDIRH